MTPGNSCVDIYKKLAVARYGDCFCVALRENSAVNLRQLESSTKDTEIVKRVVSEFTLYIDITYR